MATSPHFVRQASSERETDLLITKLLRGVSLNGEELASARAIVQADVVSRRLLLMAEARLRHRDASEHQSPVPGDAWAAWDAALGLMAQRDARLEALLRTDAQRAAFAENTSAERRVLAELRRNASVDAAEDGPVAD